MVAKHKKKTKSSAVVNIQDVVFVGDRMPYLRNTVFVEFVFRELAYKGQIPGVRKASW